MLRGLPSDPAHSQVSRACLPTGDAVAHIAQVAQADFVALNGLNAVNNVSESVPVHHLRWGSRERERKYIIDFDPLSNVLLLLRSGGQDVPKIVGFYRLRRRFHRRTGKVTAFLDISPQCPSVTGTVLSVESVNCDGRFNGAQKIFAGVFHALTN